MPLPVVSVLQAVMVVSASLLVMVAMLSLLEGSALMLQRVSSNYLQLQVVEVNWLLVQRSRLLPMAVMMSLLGEPWRIDVASCSRRFWCSSSWCCQRSVLSVASKGGLVAAECCYARR